jgi:predicted transcriptional regulator
MLSPTRRQLRTFHYRSTSQLIESFQGKSILARTKYRSTNLIIQTILEGIIRAKSSRDETGIIKSHLIKYCGLKSTTAEKYLQKMEKAGYIRARNEYWGEREITIYEITPKGKDRYNWFVMINAEIE